MSSRRWCSVRLPPRARIGVRSNRGGPNGRKRRNLLARLLRCPSRSPRGRRALREAAFRPSADRDRIFIAVIPQEGKDGHSARQARERLSSFLEKLRENGIMASGMIGDPDPYGLDEDIRGHDRPWQ